MRTTSTTVKPCLNLQISEQLQSESSMHSEKNMKSGEYYSHPLANETANINIFLTSLKTSLQLVKINLNRFPRCEVE